MFGEIDIVTDSGGVLFSGIGVGLNKISCTRIDQEVILLNIIENMFKFPNYPDMLLNSELFRYLYYKYKLT